MTPQLALVGVHVLSHWLDQLGLLDLIISALQQAAQTYRQTHPDDDLALLHHRESTLKRRLQALLLAPLLGIETLTAFDTREHPLPTLIGQGYQSSTLTQFLGQLERINAAEVLMGVLMPHTAGRLAYVDGHMIAFYVAAVVKPLCTFFFFPLFFSLNTVFFRIYAYCSNVF
jgi:hypothetical protein